MLPRGVGGSCHARKDSASASADPRFPCVSGETSRQEKRKPDTRKEYRASLTRKVLGDLYEQQLPCGQPVDCLQDATSMAGIKDKFHRSPPFYYRELLRSL